MGKSFKIDELAKKLMIRDDVTTLEPETQASLMLFASTLGALYFEPGDVDVATRVAHIGNTFGANLSRAVAQRYAKELGKSITEDLSWMDTFPRTNLAAHLPGPVWAATLISLLPHDPDRRRGLWNFIDAVFARWGEPSSGELSDIRDWLLGHSSYEYRENFEPAFNQLLSQSCIPERFALLLKPRRHGKVSDYFKLRDEVAESLDELRPRFDELNLSLIAIDDALQYIKNDTFRVSVMGEFKRGKSTLVNALLDTPNLMPSAILPCTSGLTSIRHGEETTFKVSHQRGLVGTFEDSTAEQFQAGVSQASKTRYSKGDDVNNIADSIPHWQVTIPNRFLDDNSLSLIDTPGLGEDHARDEITRREALRTNCAILVFDVEQLATLQELELIKKMGARTENLFIAINKSDRVSAGELDELRRHVEERVPNGVSKSNIYFLSAKEAGLHQCTDPSNHWSKQMSLFRAGIHEHLTKNAGAIQAEGLERKIHKMQKDARTNLGSFIEKLKTTYENGESLKNAPEDSRIKYKRAKSDIKRGVSALNRPSALYRRLEKGLFKALTKTILPTIREEALGADFSASPLTSPKVFANEVGDFIQSRFVDHISDWFDVTGQEIISSEISKLQAECIEQTSEFASYVESATGMDAATLQGHLNKASMENAFRDLYTPGNDQIAMDVALTAAVSVVIGYIISDVILYYILGLVAGFLNPVILAGAAVAAVATLFIGSGFIGDKIINKIMDELESGLAEGETRERIEQELEKVTGDVVSKLAEGFEEGASTMLEEIKRQQSKREKDLEEFTKRHGASPLQIKKRLESMERAGEEIEAFMSRLLERFEEV